MTRIVSEEISGSEGNYEWPVRFEKTHGYVRLSQQTDDRAEVVLLCPRQVRALLVFAAPKLRKPKAKS